MLNYSSIVALGDYGALQRFEEMLASCLSPMVIPSLKKPTLPSRPCKVTSNLMGKAYEAAGHAGASLHTMAILQVYQADLLNDLDSSEAIDPESVREIRWATYLALRANKQMACSNGRAMAAMFATEWHLWLNLSGIGGKESLSPGSPSFAIGPVRWSSQCCR